jgi:hypothetical protein
MFAGLLLGWIREGAPLLHDSGDADFLVQDRNWWRLMCALPYLDSIGFNICQLWIANEGQVAEITLAKDGANFEFFRYERVDGMYRHHAFCEREQITYEYPAFECVEGEFLDRTWSRPANVEDHLAAFYGDWKVPKTQFSYAHDITAIAGREAWHGMCVRR